MDLRAELTPPPVSERHLAEARREITRIAALVLDRAANAGEETGREAIAAFNARTGHRCTACDFAAYDGGRGLADFAREAARPPAPPRVADVTRTELVEIVRRLLAAGPDSHHYLRLLEANVAHPRVADLVFHPPAAPHDTDTEADATPEAGAERIVDEALAYRPITL
ncbi:hypothetical protein AB0E96_36840 [Kitasatospora sp. NPDC036755]|uniref:hypothetical protein n=1 Tax=Kitasatospora sp. NPDC036755 TaxID=3154600 RepID=UPI0033E04257